MSEFEQKKEKSEKIYTFDTRESFFQQIYQYRKIEFLLLAISISYAETKSIPRI